MIIVNEHAVRLWTQVALFTAHQRNAEMRMVTLAFNGANSRPALLAPPVSGGGFEVRFVGGILCFPERAARFALSIVSLGLAAFADPAGQFVAVEVIVGVVNEGRGGAVDEFQESRVGAFGWAR